MAIINSNLSACGLVEKYVGTAYDTVKSVSDNMEGLDKIVECIDSGACAEIIDLGENITIAAALINYKGAWDAGTQYVTGDSVTHNDLLWMSNEDNINSEPAIGNTDWVEIMGNTIGSVETYADLPIEAGEVDVLYVQGHTSPGDGGAGVFIYDATQASTSNGGTVISGWVRQYDSLCDVRWFGVFPGNPAIDNTVALQNLLDTVGTPDFVTGTYLFQGDIEYLTGCQLLIRRNAHVIVNEGRITPRLSTCTGIEFIVNGKLQQTGVTPNPSEGKFDWTVITDPGDGISRYAIRGFIEYGGYELSPASGFRLTGTGHIWGAWVGTPSQFAWADMPYKGLCTVFANDVYVGDGLEWSGFLAECVYNESQSVGAKNVVFNNNYVHDTSMNALNFSCASDSEGCVIKNNITDTCLQGVELSSGTCLNNVIRNSYSIGIMTGGGWVGQVNISNNLIEDTFNQGSAIAGGSAIVAWDNTNVNTLSGIVIRGNTIRRCVNRAIEVAAHRGFVKDNDCIDYNQGVDPAINAMYINCRDRGMVANNLLAIDPLATIDNAPLALIGPVTFGFDNYYYDDYGAYIIEKDASSSWTDQIIPSYKIITPASISGQGHKTVYTGTGSPNVLGDSYDCASAGGFITHIDASGAKGQYIIATMKSADLSETIQNTLVCNHDGGVRPGVDEVQDFGHATFRWKDIYALNPAIITSDERKKQQIQALSVAEKAVAIKLKGAIKTFKFNSAVTEKGSGARIHVGVIAQEVKTIFESEGLIAEDYALFCFDQWDEETAGKDNHVVLEAGDLYGIRYEELFAFIISAL